MVFVEKKVSSEECNLTGKFVHPGERIMRLWQQSVLRKGDLGDTSFAGSDSVQLSRVLCSCNQNNPQKQQSKKEKFTK